ncbi:MAG: hypothetical protein AAGC46_15360 [Solirubrobacteraceae bacterium]|nr:hypothetical protein [Patulibacter sp.]
MLHFDRANFTRRATAVAAAQSAVAAVALVLGPAVLRALSSNGIEVIRSALEKQAVAPTNASLITQGMATIQGNWYWFLLGTFPLAFSVLMGAVGLGVRSASDWLFRLVMAVVGIIAFAPAIVA